MLAKTDIEKINTVKNANLLFSIVFGKFLEEATKKYKITDKKNNIPILDIDPYEITA